MELEVEVFHGWGAVVICGGALDGLLVDDGDPSTRLVEAVAMCDLVSLGYCGGDVGSTSGVQPGLSEEEDVWSEGGDEVLPLGGVFA